MKDYTVYILRSTITDRFYIGQTQDLADRLRRHQLGYVRSTKGRGPWELFWSYRVATRSEAMEMEGDLKRLKSRTGLLRYLEDLE
ncbi:MAG: GIY-YIG nuclease family protein [Bacteroidota bacterium]